MILALLAVAALLTFGPILAVVLIALPFAAALCACFAINWVATKFGQAAIEFLDKHRWPPLFSVGLVAIPVIVAIARVTKDFSNSLPERLKATYSRLGFPV